MESDKASVINIGLEMFYSALILQNIKATQISWTPPIQQSSEMEALLDLFL